MKRNLTKERIIRKKTDIDAIFKAGKKYSFSCFKLLVKDNGLSYSRFMVIPVKHFGNSIERNKIRRQIKEIWRTHYEDVRPGVDCLVIVYNTCSKLNLTYIEKEKSLLNLLKVGGLLKA